MIASKFHDNKFTYIDESFTGMTNLMTIICPIHGAFQQKPDIHKRSGCQQCWYERRKKS